MSLNDRKSTTENQNALFVSEVGGLCPLCGKQLIKKSTMNLLKKYEIAHIYPCNPTKKDLDVLSTVIPPANIESSANKIALCLDCHNEYDNDKTLDKYIELRKIKDKLLEKASIDIEIYNYPLEEDISEILSKLLIIPDEEISSLELSMKAIKISDKLEDEYRLLRREIEEKVAKYFGLIQKMFKEKGAAKFESIALQIKSFYLTCKNRTIDKNVIFDEVIKWISIKCGGKDRRACAIIAAFFVQNCEVFDEISK